jgi:hypothetical protein
MQKYLNNLYKDHAQEIDQWENNKPTHCTATLFSKVFTFDFFGSSFMCSLRRCIQKFPDWPLGARTANGTALCQQVQLYRYFMSQSSEFCSHNPLCYFSTNVCCCCLFRYGLSTETFWYTFIYIWRWMCLSVTCSPIPAHDLTRETILRLRTYTIGCPH